METVIPVYVGFDPREAAAYHVFCQSVIETATQPVAFHPLALRLLREYSETHTGSNEFIHSRYLVPFLSNYAGWALFVDGDMVCLEDIAGLWALRDRKYAVQVVKRDYSTKHPRKYVGSPIESPNLDYPRKNWSSVMLWNCGHPANRILSVEHVMSMPSAYLHRLQWLDDKNIGALPARWNVLIGEEEVPNDAALLHYTLGVPGFEHYADCDQADAWHRGFALATEIVGEFRTEMMERACARL